MNKYLASLLTLVFAFTALVVSPVAASQGSDDDENATSTNDRSSGNSRQLDVVCIQDAVETREEAIIASVDTYSTDLKAAFEKRKTDLVTAWAKSDRTERRKAIRAAWTEYRKSVREARKEFKTSRREAWQEYKTDRKACGGAATSDDTGSSDGVL